MRYDARAVATRHGLTDQQRAFVFAMVDHGSTQVASQTAGITLGQGRSWLSVPAVGAALREAVALALAADAPVNFFTLRKLRDSDATPARTRADIAIKLLKLAGFVEPAAGKVSQNDTKTLAEMTSAELRTWREANQREIDRLEGELATRATDVSAPAGATIGPTPGPESLSYLD